MAFAVVLGTAFDGWIFAVVVVTVVGSGRDGFSGLRGFSRDLGLGFDRIAFVVVLGTATDEVILVVILDTIGGGGRHGFSFCTDTTLELFGLRI